MAQINAFANVDARQEKFTQLVEALDAANAAPNDASTSRQLQTVLWKVSASTLSNKLLQRLSKPSKALVLALNRLKIGSKSPPLQISNIAHIMFLQGSCDGGDPLLFDVLGKLLYGLDDDVRDAVNHNVRTDFCKGDSRTLPFVEHLITHPEVVGKDDVQVVRAMRSNVFMGATDMRQALILLRLVEHTPRLEGNPFEWNQLMLQIDAFLKNKDWPAHLNPILLRRDLERMSPNDFILLLNSLTFVLKVRGKVMK
jgi:hypothetical protein